MLGISRDDTQELLEEYVKRGIISKHPFMHLVEPVRRAMRLFIQEARKVYPDFEVMICGEHGGDPYSIDLLHKLGLTGISMSAERVQTARLASAQAALKYPRNASADEIAAKAAVSR